LQTRHAAIRGGIWFAVGRSGRSGSLDLAAKLRNKPMLPLCWVVRDYAFCETNPTRPVFFFLRDFSIQTQFTVSYCNFKEILATTSGV
ncbi:MAG: hypothetical protein ACRD22_21295, partial [Terriglobia bacterium]